MALVLPAAIAGTEILEAGAFPGILALGSTVATFLGVSELIKDVGKVAKAAEQEVKSLIMPIPKQHMSSIGLHPTDLVGKNIPSLDNIIDDLIKQSRVKPLP